MDNLIPLYEAFTLFTLPDISYWLIWAAVMCFMFILFRGIR